MSPLSAQGGERLEAAIRGAQADGRPALVGYVTGGFPDPQAFADLLPDLAAEVDILEVGIPFSDPMADGVTIQRASERALSAGATLSGILDTLAAARLERPVVLMSYLNPVLQMGLDSFAERARASGVSGLIVPDVPFEESGPLRRALGGQGVALIQLVTPLTPDERLARLCAASEGFVYAVTMTGTTGAAVASQHDQVAAYLDRVRARSPRPVLAGFGIRTAEDVRRLGAHADGAIVGSAVVEAIEQGADAAALLRALRGAAA
ncbi:MAG: tryptophan synthase subunit alpha [Gemmatimonadota bacterium]